VFDKAQPHLDCLDDGLRVVKRLALAVIGTTLAACGGSTASAIPVSSSPTPASTPPPAPAVPRSFATATATLRDLAGGRVGTAQFADSYAGVIVTATVSGLGLGAHAIHIHEVGKCEAPFTSAGGHFNPERRRHGFKNLDGHHLGDLPNIDMPAAGVLKFEFVLPGVSITGSNGLVGGDGTSIVIHSSKDDLLTDPAGDSGGRQACGVIRKS
jgi:Cu-Zn family superoxide dismutase